MDHISPSKQQRNIVQLYTSSPPDPACKPEVVGSRATFNLDLDDIYQCMVTRVVDRSTVRMITNGDGMDVGYGKNDHHIR